MGLILLPRSNDRLCAALNNFQRSLSLDQQKEFDSAIGVTPTPDDLLLLTNEINKKKSSRRSRVLADRLRVVLESVQQYSTIIDTFVQASQIAALIWGSVKLVVRV